MMDFTAVLSFLVLVVCRPSYCSSIALLCVFCFLSVVAAAMHLYGKNYHSMTILQSCCNRKNGAIFMPHSVVINDFTGKL